MSASASSANVVIRPALESDAVALAQLRHAFRSSICTVTETEKEFVERCTPWMQTRLKEESAWRCWIAESDGLPVGNLWAQLIEKIPNPTDEAEQHAYLTNLFVREDHRGRGIGSMLVSAALDWIETNDVHAVILWPTERSRSFYLQRGFSIRDDLMQLIIEGGKN